VHDERLAQRVGAIVIVLVLAAVSFFVFVADSVEWGERVRVVAYFRGTGGLRENAPIIVAGQAIGRVERIVPARIPAPLAKPDDPPTGIAVTLAIEAGWAEQLARGGDVFVAGRGALSARHVELGPSPDPDAARLADGDEVRGIDPPTLDRVLQRTWDNLTVARQFAAAVGPEFLQLRDELRTLAATLDELAPGARLAAELEALIAEAERLYEVGLGGDVQLERIVGVIGRVRGTLAQARASFAVLGERARGLRANVEAVRERVAEHGGSGFARLELAIDRARLAFDAVDPLLAKVEQLAARIARGEGSLGKLTRDPEFPEDAKALGKILKRQPWKIIGRPKD
jgi:ABC-type transporter Mla subunit MlaD